MGQQISSSKFSSLFAWTPANQTPVDLNSANSPLADCRCPLDILSEDSDAVECARCKPAPSRNLVKQNCEITSSLSSTAINNNNISSNNAGSVKNGNGRTFNSFSCFRTSHNSGSFDHTDESEDMKCKIDNINTASCSYRMKNDKKTNICHRNNDTMSGQDCDDGTSTECLSFESSSENSHPKCGCSNRDVCDMPRNLSNDSGLSNPSRSCAIDNNQEDNGNATGRISQSPNIDRYMNALTDFTEQNSICNNAACDWGNGNSEGNSVKKNHTQRCRGSSKVNSKQNRQHEMSKGCSRQHDLSAAEESLKDVGCKNNFVKKKQRWVPKFGISKSINKTGKSSISTGHRSVDSGLEVAGSTNDNLCVCTSHRTVDEVVSSPPHHNLTLGFARDRDNWVRAPSVSFESNVTYHNSGRHQAHFSSRVSYQAISGDHGIELNQEQQHSFNIPSNLANLPINIMLTRMPLGSSGGVYGSLQMSNNRAVYSTMQNNSGGVYGNSGGVYGNAGDVYGALLSEDTNNGGRSGIGGEGNVILLSVGSQNAPVIDLSRWTAEDFPLEDCEEQARERRAIEIAEGVEPPPGYRSHIQMVSPIELRALLFHQQQQQMFVANNILQTRIHTQVDYIHCLVPDLRAITSCSFYWGKMDRYEAERLLEGKPEGTFLLRDSAQEEYLFSVSFRKYGRSLHARIEQFNHKFSFDSHDPGVYAANTVTGLIEHYKDPACVMFFEPMLTAPLSRTHAFPLQHLCRAVIASTTTYDGISELRLPPTMKAYLKEYHYRQRVRIKRFEGHPEGFHWDPEENQYRENN